MNIDTTKLDQIRTLLSDTCRAPTTSPSVKHNLNAVLELMGGPAAPADAETAAPAATASSPPHTFGAFNTTFYVEHRRVPTGQETFDAGMRAGRSLQWPNPGVSTGSHAAPADTPQAGDFAKIVRGSNGQQVLFYKERDTDDGNILHNIADYENYQADMKISGISDQAFEGVLDKCDVAMADKVLAQSSGFM